MMMMDDKMRIKSVSYHDEGTQYEESGVIELWSCLRH